MPVLSLLLPTVSHDNLAFALSRSPALLSFSSGRSRSSTCVSQYLDLPYVISLVTGLQRVFRAIRIYKSVFYQTRNFFPLVYLNNFPPSPARCGLGNLTGATREWRKDRRKETRLAEHSDGDAPRAATRNLSGCILCSRIRRQIEGLQLNQEAN